MKALKAWLKTLFCRHVDLFHVRNIYGDQVNYSGGYRSVWECYRCHKQVYRGTLKF